MLRALAEKGGVTGLNFSADFLVDDANYTHVEDLVRHARHIADVAGVETVALGSDFDGIDTAPDSLIRQFNALYNDPDYTVLRTLPQGYTPQDIERCCLYQDGSDGVYLTRQEAYDFLKTVVEPDLRDSSMGKAYHGSYLEQEPSSTSDWGVMG